MRVVIGPAERVGAGPVSDSDLTELYAVPQRPWLRVNMVATVDGAATGADGRSGGINNAADKRVFRMLRQLADAVVVGAGTARVERYRPFGKPLVVVSRHAAVPPQLLDADPGSVLLATCSAAEGIEVAREALGEDNVLELGSHRVDLVQLKEQLHERGFTHLLGEGGPHLLRDLLACGAVDELCGTVVPGLIAGEHPRITAGPPVDVPLELRLLLEEDGTLLARWFC